jgi:hypothetical protein
MYFRTTAAGAHRSLAGQTAPSPSSRAPRHLDPSTRNAKPATPLGPDAFAPQLTSQD